MDSHQLLPARKPSVSEPLWRSCLAWIAEGKTLAEWSRLNDCPVDRIYRFIKRGEDGSRARDYAYARECGIGSMTEAMLSISDQATPETLLIDRLRVDARRYAVNAWIAARSAATAVGSPVQVTVSTGVPRVSVERIDSETDPGGGGPSAAALAAGGEEQHISPTHTSIPSIQDPPSP